MRVNLTEIINKPISGEWGTDDTTGNGFPVLRTTNFTNNGIVNYDNVVLRCITKKNISEKLLKKGDILIEKSGGSDKQPVGRVVFFDGEEKKYLFNNFTSLLRVNNSENWNSKYVFYSLYANYLRGGTLPYQNKTTGLLNLKLDQYLSDFSIVNISINDQNRIVMRLDLVRFIINMQQKEISKLDELIKSRFVEMFDNTQYPFVKAKEVCYYITKGTTPDANELFSEYAKDRVPFLKVYNLSFTGEVLFDQAPQFVSLDTHNDKLSRSKVYPNDVLMNIVGPPLGKFTLVTNDYPEWNINQAIAIFRAKENVNAYYLLQALMQPNVLRPFLNNAVGIRQLNLSLEQCRNLEIPLPPMNLQNQFADFVTKVERQKATVQKSIDKLETLKKSLMQEYFG